MIGMFLIQLLRLQCCGKIIAIDTQQDRLDMAKELGADKTFIAGDDEIIPTIKEMTNGRGADIAFEAVGIEKTIKTAIHSVRRGATVTLVGNLSPTVSIPLQDVVTQQLRLQGSCAIAGEYPAILEMIASGRINVDKIMSATAPLSEGAEWFKRLYDKKPGLMKVVLNP